MKTSLDSASGNSVVSRHEEHAVLAVTCLAAFLFFNSFGSISVALPLIQEEFGNSLAEIQWVSLMGVVTISSLSFCFGRAGNQLGQKRLYKVGVMLYAFGSFLASISHSFAHLLVSRGVMAVGLAMALPMSVAILAAAYAPERRGHALGLFASAIAIGRATGPTFGGFLLHLWGWPAVFVMNAAIGFLVSIAVIKIFQGAGERRREPFDYSGSISLLIGYPALLIGFTSLASSGSELGRPVWWFALAAFGLSGFVAVELRSANPLIDLRILRRGSLSKALLANLLSHALYNPITLCAPLFLKNVLHAGPLSIGGILSLLPLMTAAASPISGKLADRLPAGHVMSSGVGLILMGVFVYAMLGESSNFVAVGAALALIGLGIGCFTPANQKVAFASVSSQDYGVLSAMLSSLGTAAGTLGTTFVVALMENQMAGRSQTDPSVFAAAQQFALTWLLPLGVLALVIAAKRSRRVRDNVP